MKRKLVKQGVRALTITVPAEWIKKNDLHPGDELSILETDNTLTISTENRQVLKDISVNVSGLLPRLADRFIARAYQKGYDRITVKADDPELLHAIKNKVPELMGLEILDITKEKLEIRAISNELALDFDTLLRRAFLILLDMNEECINAWKTGDKKKLNGLMYQDLDVNKFTYFCLRHLSKSQKRRSFGSFILYYLIENLEDLGDELKSLGSLLAKIDVDKETLEILEDMAYVFKISYEYFYKPKRALAVEAFQKAKEIHSSIDNVLKRKISLHLTKALLSMYVCTRIVYHLTTMRLDTLKELGGE